MSTVLEEYSVPSPIDLFAHRGAWSAERFVSELRPSGFAAAALIPDKKTSDVPLKALRLLLPDGLIPLPSAFRTDGTMADIGLMSVDGEKLFCVPEGFEDLRKLRNLFCYASDFGVRIALRPSLSALCEKGQINESPVSDCLGMRGIPAVAEAVAVQTALMLAAEWRTPLHLRSLSCAASVEAVRSAQEAGLDVTCDVAVMNLLLDDSVYTASRLCPELKVFPALRGIADRTALWEGIESGVITAVVSNVCPRSEEALALPFEEIPFGLDDLTGSLAALMNGWERLGRPCGLARLLTALSEGPRRVLGKMPDGTTLFTRTESGWSLRPSL